MLPSLVIISCGYQECGDMKRLLENSTRMLEIYNTLYPSLYPDNEYTLVWAPILLLAILALSLAGILAPLWEFFFSRKHFLKSVSMISVYINETAERDHVSEMNSTVILELARLLEKPLNGGKGWRELANVLGYQYEVKKSDSSQLVSPTVSLLNRWKFTNTATVQNLLKSLHAIERRDCAQLLEIEYEGVIVEYLAIA